MAKLRVEQKPVKPGFFDRPRNRHITVWIIEIILVLALAAGFAYAFCFSVTIQESSMDPTVLAGDTVRINRIAYTLGTVKRGDLIAYRSSSSEDASIHVKRVIGLPGEKIQIKDGMILINGKTYMENRQLPSIQNAGLASTSISLGTTEYFVLGDNRNNSEDSRFADVGNISRGNILGKVWLITSPADRFGFVS